MNLIEKVIPDSEKIYKPSAPFLATVLENRRLTPPGHNEDVRHVVLDLCGSGLTYLEGQSVGIVPPGLDEKGKNHRVRLYSIASSRNGDDGLSASVSLCVKRVVFQDPETGEEKRGLASNFICDLKPGDLVPLTGPTGRKFLLPADDSVHLIMVAAGTGIAPFRSFIKHIYKDRREWKGKVRLFFGAKTGLDSLYMNEEANDIGLYYTEDTFRAFKALSREDRKPDGGKIYVQDRIEEQREEVWNLIKEGHFALYICGLRGLEEGIEEIFHRLAQQDGLNWDEMREGFKQEGRWNIEVY